MKTLKLGAVALAVTFALGSSAMAQSMSARDYRVAQEKISTEFQEANRACITMAGARQAICNAQAEGVQAVQLAELEFEYRPSATTRYEASVAQGDANYAVAVKRCDEQTGAARSACVSTAEQAQTAARATADRQMRSAAGDAATASSRSATSGQGPMAAHTLFDFGSAELRPEAHAALDQFVADFRASDADRIEAVGYTDRLGSSDVNQPLSERRAEAVSAYLRSQGVESNRVRTSGKGAAQPETGTTECQGERSATVITCLQPDRRVTLAATGTRSSP